MQPHFDRGYTGHEHMAGFGLINMNGRVYDPYLQRFLSPDPFVQAPANAQNFNRYSYCLNNPLMYTDPSGYFFLNIGKSPNGKWFIRFASSKFSGAIFSLNVSFLRRKTNAPNTGGGSSSFFMGGVTFDAFGGVGSAGAPSLGSFGFGGATAGPGGSGNWESQMHNYIRNQIGYSLNEFRRNAIEINNRTEWTSEIIEPSINVNFNYENAYKKWKWTGYQFSMSIKLPGKTSFLAQVVYLPQALYENNIVSDIYGVNMSDNGLLPRGGYQIHFLNSNKASVVVMIIGNLSNRNSLINYIYGR